MKTVFAVGRKARKITPMVAEDGTPIMVTETEDDVRFISPTGEVVGIGITEIEVSVAGSHFN